MKVYKLALGAVLCLIVFGLVSIGYGRELIVDGDYVKIKRTGGYAVPSGDYDIVTERYVRIFNENDLDTPVFIFDTLLKMVGIGTDDPAYALHVIGDIFATDSITASRFCLGGICISSWDDLISGLSGAMEINKIVDKDDSNYLLDPDKESFFNAIYAETVKTEKLFIGAENCELLYTEDGEVKCGQEGQTLYREGNQICISGTGSCVEDREGTSGITSCSQCDSRFINEGQSAGGDLSGSYPSPEVVGIQGRPVSPEDPEDGDVLKWNGSQWAPGRVNCTVSSQCVDVDVSGGSATCPAGYVMVGINVRSTPYCVKTYMSSCGNYMGYFCGINSVTSVRCCQLVCN